MNPKLLLFCWSAVSGVAAVAYALILALLWPRKHVPVVGFLWLFLAAMLVREGLLMALIIGAVLEVLPEDISAIQVVFFVTQFVTTIPALLLGLFAVHIVPESWITWLFRPPGDTAANESEGVGNG